MLAFWDSLIWFLFLLVCNYVVHVTSEGHKHLKLCLVLASHHQLWTGLCWIEMTNNVRLLVAALQMMLKYDNCGKSFYIEEKSCALSETQKGILLFEVWLMREPCPRLNSISLFYNVWGNFSKRDRASQRWGNQFLLSSFWLSLWKFAGLFWALAIGRKPSVSAWSFPRDAFLWWFKFAKWYLERVLVRPGCAPW